jgi:hypothetical protein
MLVEGLILKGGITLVSYIAHHAAALKVAGFAYKAYKTYTIAQLASAAIGVCVVVGGVTWCSENVDRLKKGANAIKEGNTIEALKNFGRLAYSLHGGVSTLPEAAHSALIQLHVSEEEACKVAGWLRSRESEILKYATSMR